MQRFKPRNGVIVSHRITLAAVLGRRQGVFRRLWQLTQVRGDGGLDKGGSGGSSAKRPDSGCVLKVDLGDQIKWRTSHQNLISNKQRIIF